MSEAQYIQWFPGHMTKTRRQMQKDIDSFKGNASELADLIRRYNEFFKNNRYNVKDDSFTEQKNICFTKLKNR